MKSLFYTKIASEDDVHSIFQFEQKNKDWFLNYLPKASLDKIDLPYLQSQVSQQDNKKFYLILNRQGELIGRFNLYFLNPERSQVEVVYRMDKDWAGKGVASYTLKRLMAYWASSGVEEIHATTLKSNLASNRLLIRAGFFMKTVPAQSILIGEELKETIEYVWLLNH